MTEEILRMNLVAIQNVDPYAKEILDSSPHVAFYKFVNNEWEKTEIEGSFFVYSRVAEPFNSIFINNRLNTQSLVEPITKQIELQSQPPFLLYRNQRSAISGFWFYSKDDCVRVHSLLEELIKKCNNANPRPAENINNNHHHHHPVQPKQQQQAFNKSQNQGQNGKQDVDIFSMLSKAQQDFNNSGASVSDRTAGEQQLKQKFSGMQLGHPPQQQQHHQQQQQPQPNQQLIRQLSSAMPDITSPNVVNFFAAAQQPNGGGPGNSEGKQIHQSQNKQFIANHPNAPPVQTLDEIEKQHRVSSSPPQQHVGELKYQAEPKMIKTEFNNLLSSVAQQQHHQHTISPIRPVIKLQQPGAFQPQIANKPTLITPAMFQAPHVDERTAVSAPVQTSIRPEPLTQNQLIQALNYMLETDPEFIRKVHEAYVKSFNKIVSL